MICILRRSALLIPFSTQSFSVSLAGPNGVLHATRRIRCPKWIGRTRSSIAPCLKAIWLWSTARRRTYSFKAGSINLLTLALSSLVCQSVFFCVEWGFVGFWRWNIKHNCSSSFERTFPQITAENVSLWLKKKIYSAAIARCMRCIAACVTTCSVRLCRHRLHQDSICDEYNWSTTSSINVTYKGSCTAKPSYLFQKIYFHKTWWWRSEVKIRTGRRSSRLLKTAHATGCDKVGATWQ